MISFAKLPVELYNFPFYMKWQSHLSKEVWKSNFRQYAEMEKQRWEESERRCQEVRRSEKRKSGKQEDARYAKR